MRIILGQKLVPEHDFVHLLFLFRTSFTQRWIRQLASLPRSSKHLRVITWPPNLSVPSATGPLSHNLALFRAVSYQIKVNKVCLIYSKFLF